MGYDLNSKCATEGCEGTPFLGESLSRGFCDACHVDRVTMWDMLSVLDELLQRELNPDETHPRSWQGTGMLTVTSGGNQTDDS